MERYNLVVIGCRFGRPRRRPAVPDWAPASRWPKNTRFRSRRKAARPWRACGDCLHWLRAFESAPAAAKAPRRARSGPLRDPGRQRSGSAGSRTVMDRSMPSRPTSAPADSVERFEGSASTSFRHGQAQRLKEVSEVNGTTVWGRHVVVATASPGRTSAHSRPRGDGLLTNESVWHARALPPAS